MTILQRSLELFPTPTHRGGVCSWEDTTTTATTALQKILTHNHGRWHVYINDKRFNNHTAHNMLTLWALGADEIDLESSYKESRVYLKPAIVPPGTVTLNNWKDHLGDASYFQAYLDFFRDEVREKGIEYSLEEYIFSKSANVACGELKSPDMLSRMLDHLMHSLIHIGFACEFGQPGLVAEGLAHVAVHKDSSRSVVTLEEDEYVSECRTDAFTVLARIIEDPELVRTEEVSRFEGYLKTTKTWGDKIKFYAMQWSLDGPIEAKIEELAWINTMIYGIGGWEGPEKRLNADYFHAHLLGSSMALSAFVTYLSAPSQQLLLRNYFASSLVWYLARGRAPINIERFYMDDAGSSMAKLSKSSLLSENGSDVTLESILDSKSWNALRYEAIHHQDEHFSSIQRPLVHYFKMYGETPQGTFSNTKLKGAERLDGSLFLRVARLTSERTTGSNDGQLEVIWDYRGFYRGESPRHD